MLWAKHCVWCMPLARKQYNNLIHNSLICTIFQPTWSFQNSRNIYIKWLHRRTDYHNTDNSNQILIFFWYFKFYVTNILNFRAINKKFHPLFTHNLTNKCERKCGRRLPRWRLNGVWIPPGYIIRFSQHFGFYANNLYQSINLFKLIYWLTTGTKPDVTNGCQE